MITLEQGLILSFLDWNRMQKRELPDLRRIGADNYASYEALVKKFAEESEIDFDGRNCKGLRMHQCYLGLCTDEESTLGVKLPIDTGMRHHGRNIGLKEFAERYEKVPNRAYVFATDSDEIFDLFAHRFHDDFDHALGNRIDVVLPRPSQDVPNRYDYINSMYMFAMSGSQSAEMPFFLIYSKNGFSKISIRASNAGNGNLLRVVRALSDRFGSIPNAASQKQLKEIARKIESELIGGKKKDGKAQRLRVQFGLIAAIVSIVAGTSTLLANLEQVKAVTCDHLARFNLIFCAAPREPD